MSKDGAGGVYDRRHAIPIGVGALALVLGGLASLEQNSSGGQSVPIPDPHGDFDRLLVGRVAVSEGVNIRTFPNLPLGDNSFFRRVLGADNKVPWGRILEVNGVPLNGAAFFTIKNAPLVNGERTYKDPARAKREFDPWIRLEAKLRGLGSPINLFVNYSAQTYDFVRPINNYPYLLKAQMTGGVYRTDWKDIDPQTVGEVTMHPGLRDDADLWAEEIKQRLDGVLPLEGDKIYPEVEVVPADRRPSYTCEEMKVRGTMVEVATRPRHLRRSSDPEVPSLFIPLGTIIRQAILTDDGFLGAFRRESIQGDLFDSAGNRADLPVDQLLITSSDFLRDPRSCVPKAC